MPTRKQRRRQEKLRRHEWEEVWVDAEGHEVDVEPTELGTRKRDATARNGTGAAPASKRTGRTARDARGRPIRTIQPPSWNRVLKRGAIFLPLMFVVISLTNRSGSLASRLLIALFYGVMLIPLMYLMDRMTYRAYLRRTGQAPAAAPRERKRRT